MLTYNPINDRWVTTPTGVPLTTRSKNPEMIDRMRRIDQDAVREVIDWLSANGWSQLANEIRRELDL